MRELAKISIYKSAWEYSDFVRGGGRHCVGVDGAITVDLNKILANKTKKLASYIKRGYANAQKSPFAKLYKFVVGNNPIHELPHAYMSLDRFSFPFLSLEDTEAFNELMLAYIVMKENQKQIFSCASRREDSWYVLGGVFSHKCPARTCNIVKPYLNKYKEERMEIVKWLVSDEPKVFVIPIGEPVNA